MVLAMIRSSSAGSVPIRGPRRRVTPVAAVSITIARSFADGLKHDFGVRAGIVGVRVDLIILVDLEPD